MDNDARDDATNRPVSFNNEATQDATVFDTAPPSPTAGASAASGGGLYCNRMTAMRISNKRRISTERKMIARIFMRKKDCRMTSNFSTKNSTMTRRRILMNTFISTNRSTRAKNNSNSGTKKTKMMTIITKDMKMRRKSGTRYLTGISLRNLYCP